MSAQFFHSPETVAPTKAEAEQATEASRRLSAYLFATQAVRLQPVEEGKRSEAVSVPAAAMRLLVSPRLSAYRFPKPQGACKPLPT